MNWAELIPQEAVGFTLAEGMCAKTLDSVDDEFQVVVPVFDKNQRFTGLPWMPRVDDSGDLVYPSKGDRCCVGLADTQHSGEPEMWIIGWWPA